MSYDDIDLDDLGRILTRLWNASLANDLKAVNRIMTTSFAPTMDNYGAVLFALTSATGQVMAQTAPAGPVVFGPNPEQVGGDAAKLAVARAIAFAANSDDEGHEEHVVRLADTMNERLEAGDSTFGDAVMRAAVLSFLNAARGRPVKVVSLSEHQ